MPTISCTEFSRKLSEAVEHRDSVDTVALREHAGLCAECRGLWLDAMLVDRALAHWKKPVAATGLTERILSQVAAGAAPGVARAPLRAEVELGKRRLPFGTQRRTTRTVGLALTALALCACALLFLGRPLRQSEVAQNPPSIAAVNSPTIKTGQRPISHQISPPTVGAPVELMVADAGSAYLHLAGDAAKAVTAASVLVPSADAVRQARPLPKGEEPWVDGVRREIAPVTHQLSHAFEFLIQAVPKQQAPAT